MPLLLNDAPNSYLAINAGGYLRLNSDVDITPELTPAVANWSAATLARVLIFSLTPAVATWSGQTLIGYTLVDPADGDGDCGDLPRVASPCDSRPRVPEPCYTPRRAAR